jgi:hypothetical protein
MMFSHRSPLSAQPGHARQRHARSLKGTLSRKLLLKQIEWSRRVGATVLIAATIASLDIAAVIGGLLSAGARF